MSHHESNNELARDLERRIDALEHIDEQQFGLFTRLDWAVLIIASLVIPIIVIIAFR